jgi:hypothetical protein
MLEARIDQIGGETPVAEGIFREILQKARSRGHQQG